MTEMWMAARTMPKGSAYPVEVLGVFSDREKAVARCTNWGIPDDSWGDWIARLILDQALPEESVEFEELYWVRFGRLFDRHGQPLDGDR